MRWDGTELDEVGWSRVEFSRVELELISVLIYLIPINASAIPALPQR